LPFFVRPVLILERFVEEGELALRRAQDKLERIETESEDAE